MTDLSRIDLLELDIDCRIADLWRELDTFPETLEREQAAAFMRAAYGSGYVHALSEAERGELCKTHGYSTPSRGDLRRAA